jgi:hypothetical protein
MVHGESEEKKGCKIRYQGPQASLKIKKTFSEEANGR